MKTILATLTLVLILCVSGFTADATPVFEYGLMSTDGGSTHPAYFIGTEIPLKTTQAGFCQKTRLGYYQFRGESPENQGFYAWSITQQRLSESIWNLYIAAGTGFLNQVEDGDDTQKLGIMLETGCELFNRVPFGLGAKLFPEDGRGDKVFGYVSLSFNLP